MPQAVATAAANLQQVELSPPQVACRIIQDVAAAERAGVQSGVATEGREPTAALLARVTHDGDLWDLLRRLDGHELASIARWA